MTIGTMGKKDAKREYYQVEEVRRKDELCYTKRSTSCDEESVECGVSESGRMKLFV